MGFFIIVGNITINQPVQFIKSTYCKNIAGVYIQLLFYKYNVIST